MKSKFIRYQILTAFTMAILLPTIHAATTITYVGYQANVEAKINDTTSGWRNSDPAKPLDVDGDNILGTDGYSIFQGGFGQVASLPTYISNVTALASGSNASSGWGVMDDPSNPTGNDTVAFGMWFNSLDIAQFTISGTSIPSSFRLGILVGGYGGSGTQTLTLTQTVGGTATATQAGIASDNSQGLSVAFFDFDGVSAGDTFKLSIPTYSTGYRHASGFVFDSIPEPRAALLTGLGALLLLLRRRR